MSFNYGDKVVAEPLMLLFVPVVRGAKILLGFRTEDDGMSHLLPRTPSMRPPQSSYFFADTVHLDHLRKVTFLSGLC